MSYPGRISALTKVTARQLAEAGSLLCLFCGRRSETLPDTPETQGPQAHASPPDTPETGLPQTR
ncbi:hypothetical protein GCM10010403_11530 [Glycomyces rutgersensis]|uniref:Uncharacterized protein n=1 Tax=Glycomyces rutgersensis TaxID=58115 RepID=A0ABP5S7L5_9ACTN